jgi:DNA repair exonuclease SbcCD ATPase subunit
VAGFEDAVQELSQVPLPSFIAERKRLADALKADGDAKAAKQLLARKRPTISAWVVNQLYWHARDAFDDLLATAEKIRKGDLKASAAHRDAIAALRARAKRILEDAGHAAPEATLRRVTTTLSAIAVAGGFDPDPPGALAEDRDPPGFAAFGLAGGDVAADEPKADEEPAKPTKKHDGHAKTADGHAKREHDDELAKARAKKEREREREDREDARAREKAEKQAEKEREAEAAAQRAAEMAEKKREEAEKKRIAAERHRLEAALRSAKAELHDRERDVKQLEKQLEKARNDIEDAQEIVDDLARKLDDLEGAN